VSPQLSPHGNMLSSICGAQRQEVGGASSALKQRRLALHRSARLHPTLPSS
ncbi:hypothetical protein KUCAC02_020942, partial [Chaenocephalus aceratus]